MRDQKKAEEIAVQGFQLIAPLLAEGLDAGKAKELKDQICKSSGLSERTIRRYVALYRYEGFGGLKSKGVSRLFKFLSGKAQPNQGNLNVLLFKKN